MWESEPFIHNYRNPSWKFWLFEKESNLESRSVYTYLFEKELVRFRV
jgi:hypothetical protein